MMSVILTQWCLDERLEAPNAKGVDTPAARVFEVDEAVSAFASLSTQDNHSIFYLGTTVITMDTIDRTIENVIY
jgi:hypothetical protein